MHGYSLHFNLRSDAIYDSTLSRIRGSAKGYTVDFGLLKNESLVLHAYGVYFYDAAIIFAPDSEGEAYTPPHLEFIFPRPPPKSANTPSFLSIVAFGPGSHKNVLFKI